MDSFQEDNRLRQRSNDSRRKVVVKTFLYREDIKPSAYDERVQITDIQSFNIVNFISYVLVYCVTKDFVITTATLWTRVISDERIISCTFFRYRTSGTENRSAD